MKEYIKVQKNVGAIMTPIGLGFVSTIISIVLLCTYTVLGMIFSIITVVGIILTLAILVANCEISKIKISGEGIEIKEKTGFRFILWEDFTNCEVEHKSRGVYKFVLIANEKKYCIYHCQDVLVKIISYCSLPEFAKLLKAQIDKA